MVSALRQQTNVVGSAPKGLRWLRDEGICERLSVVANDTAILGKMTLNLFLLLLFPSWKLSSGLESLLFGFCTFLSPMRSKFIPDPKRFPRGVVRGP